ncbi:hypothetical protein AB0I16_32895 [Streptomyces sp. NPDC050703]|uniref:hypothetical protein n=1 Tax=Streptomyces sp. NPDC050703 TaxID=3157218 RepID=UPI003442B8C0
MDEQSVRGATAPAPGAALAASDQPGVVGIALAAVLTAMLAEGSWQWFATYVGVTLLAIVFCFYRLPRWTPGLRAAYVRHLTVYALVVGLCAAIALAPMLQRWSWLFPMPGTRAECGALGTYEDLTTRAALADLADRSPEALAHAQAVRSHAAAADCLSATTTLWLPVYAAGAAVLVGLVAAFSAVRGRRPAGARRDP